MDGKRRAGFFLACVAAAVVIPGCSRTPQASKFRMAFLPPAPHPALAVPDPPPIPPNSYLASAPAVISSMPAAPERKFRGDELADQADRRWTQGKRFYQLGMIAQARTEFDGAVDLLLEASSVNPGEGLEYHRKMDKMVDSIHSYDVAGLGASADAQAGEFEEAPLEDILEMTFPVDPKLKDRVREQVAATSSQLPLSFNDAVLGYIHYFSGTRGHRTLIYGTERSGRYRPMIQRVLDEEGVPQELIHLAQAESGFMPRAVSRKAAGGMWQFLASRGAEYGLIRTTSTDDRMDPEKATRAAAKHLHDLYREFGDWYLAIAAYNCGPVAVEKAVERTGYADFWELRSRGALPAETTNYVPIILAMAIMEKNAAEYGLDSVQLDAPLEYDTVETEAPTSLALVADITDTPLPELTALNPAVLKGTAPANFALHVPKGSARQLIAALQMVPPEHRDAWRMHRMAAGESADEIGTRYGAAPSAILEANEMRSGEAVEGDWLLIPASAARPRATSPRATVRKSSTRRPAVKTAAGKTRLSASKRVSKAAAPKKAAARSVAVRKPASKSAALVSHAVSN
jgi:membrane-bound lytic murein transglycosylase D